MESIIGLEEKVPFYISRFNKTASKNNLSGNNR